MACKLNLNKAIKSFQKINKIASSHISPLPLKSTSKNLLQLRERPAEWRGRGSVCGRGLDFEWEIENPLFGDKIHMPYNSPI